VSGDSSSGDGAPQPPVLVQDDGAVRVVTLNRPARLNAFTIESYRLLTEALADADADDGIKVALLRGAGRAFSSGVDLTALAEVSDPAELTATFDVLVRTLAGFSKPLVAGAHGFAVGFGMTLLLHCDLVVVADDARLRAPFAELGTAPEAASSWLLPRLIGAQRAADILLTARWIAGAEAARLGLAAQACPAAQVPSAALALAHDVAALNGPALAAAKRLLRQGWGEQVAAATQREFAESRALRETNGPLARPAS